MTTSSRRQLGIALTVLFLTTSTSTGAQEVGEQPVSEAFATQDEIGGTPNPIAETDATSLNQRQPITKDELEAAYGPEALAIMNEQLRHEIDLLAREYRESERRNEIQLFGLGALVALIFLSIGFLIGKRFGGRRLL